jgi:predicted nucleotidyltransferase
MKPYNEIEKRLYDLKPYLAIKFKVMNIGVFGSYSKGTQTTRSDIDILVELSEPLGWEFFDLKEYLESELNRPVDLVTRSALKNQLRDQILSQTNFV